MSRVLVVAAHPDDEVLGVGGTVVKHVSEGDAVHCLILGEGCTSRFEKRELADRESVSILHGQTLKSAELLGYEKVEFGDFPDNRFDQMNLIDIVKCIEKKVQEFEPDIIYTHHGKDLNIDHQYVFKAVLTAVRPMIQSPVKELYTFETLSSTEWNFGKENVFTPNIFVDAKPFIDKKIEAMKCYETELCNYPHPRSIKGIYLLSEYRGMTVGKEYVEAFECIFKIMD